MSLPTRIRRRVESESGADLSDVTVHDDAAGAAALDAVAFTYGSRIHRSPLADDDVLLHEARHAAQQQLGRVSPTTRFSGIPGNDDLQLERAATTGECVTTAAAYRRDTPVVQRFRVTQPDPLGPRLVDADGAVYLFAEDGPDGSWIFHREGDTNDRYHVTQLEPGAYDMEPLGDDEMEVEPPTFGVADVKEPAPRIAEDLLREQGFKMARLTTGFTALVGLHPVTGHDTGDGELSAPGHRHVCSNLIITDLVVGDRDRASTYLDPTGRSGNIPQGKHTTSWALIRRGLMGFRGQSLDRLLGFLRSRIATARQHLASSEGKFLLDRSSVTDMDSGEIIGTEALIEQLTCQELPIDAWSSIASQVMKLYIQVHHQSVVATVSGRSTNRDEGGGLALLHTAEEALAIDPESMSLSLDEVTRAALKQLDITQRMDPDAYVAAIHEWVAMLSAAFPAVMHYHGTTILLPILHTKLGKRFTEKIGKTGTVEDLLATLAIGLDVPTTLPTPHTVVDITRLTNLDDTRLMSFVANVEVMLNDSTLADPSAPGFWGPTELIVRRVEVSDKDRPGTQYRNQESHTLAWTLLRHELMSFGNASVTDLLDYLRGELGELQADVLVGKAAHEVVGQVPGDDANAPLNTWSVELSRLIRYLVHLHQGAYTSTFVDSGTPQPFGHGEAQAMRTLHEAEQELAASNECRSTAKVLAEHAIKLLDLPDAQQDAWQHDPDAGRKLVARWWRAIERTFPRVASGAAATLWTTMVARLKAQGYPVDDSWTP